MRRNKDPNNNTQSLIIMLLVMLIVLAILTGCSTIDPNTVNTQKISIGPVPIIKMTF
jgi:uncharacterized protein YceK